MKNGITSDRDEAVFIALLSIFRALPPEIQEKVDDLLADAEEMVSPGAATLLSAFFREGTESERNYKFLHHGLTLSRVTGQDAA